MQNLARFRTTSKFGANISETDEDIQNRIFIPSTSNPPALGEASPVKFGPVTLEISMLNRTHPVSYTHLTLPTILRV